MTPHIQSRVCLLIICLSLIEPGNASAAQDPGSFARSLAALVAIADRDNPEIQAARARFEQVRAEVPRVTAWPNPQVSLRYFAQEVETRLGPQVYALGLTQPIPWPQRLRLQGEAASLNALAAEAEIDVIRNRVHAELTHHWIDLARLARALAILDTARELVASLETTLRAGYATGSTAHPDLIRSQIELGKIDNERLKLAAERIRIIAALNALLRRAPSAPVPAAPPLELERRALRGLHADEEALIREIARNNPGIRALDAAIAAAETHLQRARIADLPDFALGFDYTAIGDSTPFETPGSGRDALSVRMSVTLPLSRGKYRAEQQGAEARAQALRAQRVRQLQAITASLASLRVEWRDAEREAALYRTQLLPQAELILSALVPSYASGGASFAELIEAGRLVLELELAEAREIARHNKALASAEALLAAPALESGVQEPQP